MGTHDAYTRLLGLALRGGNLVTGSDAVQSAAHAGQIRLLMISADASPHVCRDAQTWAERGNCLLIALPCDKAELGGALGRGNVAVAALTDTGLAAAVGERLAQFDPVRYTDTAERLKRKVERAGERKAAKARARPNEAAKRKSNAASAAQKRKPGATSDDKATRKPGAASDDKLTGKPGAASNDRLTRKPGAASDDKATGKPGAASDDKLTGKPGAASNDRLTRKPGAAKPKPGAARKSAAATTRKPNAAHGRPPNRAGKPRSRRKDTDT